MNNKMYNVKNRSASMVVYKIPEEGIRREFAPGETKRISYGELEKLSYQSGGRSLMTNFLQITDDEVINNLNIHAENEYFISEEQIIDLLKTEGNMDAFLDCLDYAPVGVIDLIKQFAVSLPLNSLEKRQAIKEKTGFDVNQALQHIEEEKLESKEEVSAPVASTGRRTTTNYKKPESDVVAPKPATSNYKVITKKK